MSKVRIYTVVTPRLKNALRKKAKKLGMSMTDYVESVLSKSLKSN